MSAFRRSSSIPATTRTPSTTILLSGNWPPPSPPVEILAMQLSQHRALTQPLVLAPPCPAGKSFRALLSPRLTQTLLEHDRKLTINRGLTSESGSTLPASLRYVSVPVVSRATCRSEYGTSAITDNMFCAAASGKDSCSGDSGGPITITSTGVLAGTVSWGQGCAEAGFAGVYERIGNYVTYINANKF